MDSLNLRPEQISVIEKHVQKAELKFSHLEADLIDHMCCYVEELMQRGKTFDDALNRVRNEVGLTTLKNIEIETIILLNQKFKAMKTFLKISGITGIGLFLVSSIFKINHWPGSVWLMFFGSLFIIFAYTPALLLTLKKEKMLKGNLSLFYSGLAASVFFIGTWMFTINHWPYSNLLRMLFWLSSIVFIILLFGYSLKKEANRIINLSAVLMLSFMLISSITMYSVIKGDGKRMHLYSMKEVSSGILYAKQQNKKLHQLIANEDSLSFDLDELNQKTEQFLNELNSLRTAIYTDFENKRKDNYQIFIIGKDQTYLEPAKDKFDTNIKKYRKFLISTLNDNYKELAEYIDESLGFSPKVFYNHDVVVHNTLNLIEREVYRCQNQILLLEIMQ